MGFGLKKLFKGKKNRLSGHQIGARDAYLDFGNSGPSDLLASVLPLVQETAGGGFLGSANPHRDAAIEAAIAPAQEAFQTSIAPSIAARASAYGRSGSPAEAAAFGDAATAFGRGLAETSARIGYQDYATERQNQINAVIQALGLAQFQHGEQLAKLGALDRSADIQQLGRGRSGGLFKGLAPIAGAAAGSFFGPAGAAVGKGFGDMAAQSLFSSGRGA